MFQDVSNKAADISLSPDYISLITDNIALHTCIALQFLIWSGFINR